MKEKRKGRRVGGRQRKRLVVKKRERQREREEERKRGALPHRLRWPNMSGVVRKRKTEAKRIGRPGSMFRF